MHEKILVPTPVMPNYVNNCTIIELSIYLEGTVEDLRGNKFIVLTLMKSKSYIISQNYSSLKEVIFAV